MFSVTQSNRDMGCAARVVILSHTLQVPEPTAGITHLPHIKLHGPNKASCHRLRAEMETNRCKKVIKGSSGTGCEEAQGKDRGW